MLRDLELLETDGIAFKFFLWDQLEPFYSEIARTDRIRQETLEWDDPMLTNMWEKRLKAYSSGKVSGLNQISELTSPYSVDDLALIFANRSPRDMIRIGARVISEQREIVNHSNRISREAIYRAVEKFSELRASEIVTEKTLHDLRRVHQIDFTIPYLANEVFREKQASTRNRLMRWRREGAVVDVDRIENPDAQKSHPVKLMAIADARIAKVMQSDLDIASFLHAKYKKCQRCGSTVLRDWGDADSASRCHACQFDLAQDESSDTWDTWKRKELATQSRKRQRREKRELWQRSFFDEGWDS